MRAADSSFVKAIKASPRINKQLIISGVALSILSAYLAVNGQWQLALGALLALPGVILLHRYPWLALVVWLLLDPFLIHTPTMTERRLFWMVHRALPLITAGIIVLSSALHISHRKLPKLGFPELAMGGYILLSLFSIWELNDKPLATTYLFYDRVIIPACLYLVVRFTVQDGESARRLIPVLIFLAVSQSIIGILSWYLPQMLPKEWLEQVGSRTTGSLGNASVYTTALTFSGLLVLHAGLTSKDGLFRKISILTFYLASYCIFISFSRASWLGGIFMLLGLLYLYPRFTLTTSIAVSALILIFGSWLLADQIQWAQDRFRSSESERSALSRLPVYYASLRMFQAKPLLGWGYANFDQFDRRFQGRVADLPNDNKDHASHNLYLTTAAEQGLLGLGLFLGPMLWLLFLSLKAFPRMPINGFWSRKLLVILWLVILGHIAVNNFSNMRVVFGLGMWWITLGLIASLVYPYRKSNTFKVVAPAARPSLRPGYRLSETSKISK